MTVGSRGCWLLHWSLDIFFFFRVKSGWITSYLFPSALEKPRIPIAKKWLGFFSPARLFGSRD